MIYIDETYIKPVFGGRKRRVHELSVDNPKFEHHFQKHQAKELKKALTTTRLWASAGPTTITSGGDQSYGGVHTSPQNSTGYNRHVNNSINIPNNSERYNNYPTVRRIGNYSTNQQSPYSNQVNRSPFTQSLPAHQI